MDITPIRNFDVPIVEDELTDELLAVPLPERTLTYQPVGHRQLVDLVKDLASQTLFNYALTGESFSLQKGGAEMFGRLTFEPVSGKIFDTSSKDMDLIIGIVNSYNRRVAVKFASGSAVIKSNNMLFLGDVTYMRKHTPKVLPDVNEAILEALSRAEQSYESAQRDAQMMQYVQMSQSNGFALLGKLFGQKILNTPQLNAAVRTWRATGETLWDLYLAVDSALGTKGVSKVLERHIELHQTFVNYIQHKEE